jgi:predicted DNA-binding transcriptional regulator AlpA
LERYAHPIIGDLPVSAIDTGLILKVLEPIWTVKPETAGRVRGRIERVLDWAKARGLRHGENPAAWKGHLDKLLPTTGKLKPVRHHPALPYVEISSLISALGGHSGISARALEITILTALRTSEVIGATWDEIDLAARVLTVPGSRMKSGREHRVPLCDRAIASSGTYRAKTATRMFSLVARVALRLPTWPCSNFCATFVPASPSTVSGPHSVTGPQRRRATQPRRRDGFGAYGREQGRGCLSAWRSVRQTPTSDERVGAILPSTKCFKCKNRNHASRGKIIELALKPTTLFTVDGSRRWRRWGLSSDSHIVAPPGIGNFVSMDSVERRRSRMANDDELKILRRREVQNLTGLPTSSLYQLIANAEFPRPVKLSARRVGWLASEVKSWIARRLADRDPSNQARTSTQAFAPDQASKRPEGPATKQWSRRSVQEAYEWLGRIATYARFVNDVGEERGGL